MRAVKVLAVVGNRFRFHGPVPIDNRWSNRVNGTTMSVVATGCQSSPYARIRSWSICLPQSSQSRNRRRMEPVSEGPLPLALGRSGEGRGTWTGGDNRRSRISAVAYTAVVSVIHPLCDGLGGIGRDPLSRGARASSRGEPTVSQSDTKRPTFERRTWNGLFSNLRGSGSCDPRQCRPDTPTRKAEGRVG